MRLVAYIHLILAAAGLVHSQSGVTLCDLIHNPAKYTGKEVTIRATYRYGFEWSELYCLDCQDQGKVSLETPTDLEDTSGKALKKIPTGGGIVNLTVRGIFVSDGSFGDSNSYRYKIEAVEISDVVVLLKGTKSREEEEKIEKRYACGGTHPK
jgi:hypothetical protein